MAKPFPQKDWDVVTDRPLGGLMADKQRHKYFWCGVDVDVMTNDQLRNTIKIIADQNDGSVKQLMVIQECPSAQPGMANRFHSFNQTNGKCVFCGRKNWEIKA